MESYCFRSRADKTCSNSPTAVQPPPNVRCFQPQANGGTKIIIIISLLVFSSCNNRNDKIKLNDVNTVSEINYSEKYSVEDFNTFLTKFEQDSIFQISRIVFPLEGYSSDYIIVIEEEINGDSISYIENKPDKDEYNYFVKDRVFYWKKQGWDMIQPFYDPENRFNRTFKETVEGNNKFILEEIKGKKENVYTLLKYQLIDNKWYLMYYSDEWY